MATTYRPLSTSEGTPASGSHAAAAQQQPPQSHNHHHHDHASTASSSSSHSSLGGGGEAGASASLSRRSSLSERVGEKVTALLWVLTAALVAWWSDFYGVLVFHPSTTNVNLSLLHIVAVLVGIQITLLAYLILYLPYVKGLTDSSAWEVYCPRVIPTATLLGVVSMVLLIRATWPVWGFLSPLLLGLEGLGLLFGLHFVPWPF